MLPKIELLDPCCCISSINGAIVIGSLFDIVYGIMEGIFVLINYGGPVDYVSSYLWDAMLGGVIVMLMAHVYFSSMLIQGVTKERVRLIEAHLIFKILHFLVSLTILFATLHLLRFSIETVIMVQLLRLFFIYVVYCALIKIREFVAMSEMDCDDSCDEKQFVL